mgnify:FL=1
MKQLSEETIQAFLHIKPAYKRIYLTLRQALLTGEISPGEKLPEESLALQLGTSRTPLRRALESLKKEGLLGAASENFCPHISKKDMNSLLDFDVLLESHAAFLAAQTGISREHMDTLREINQRLRTADNSLRYDSRYEKDLVGVRDLHLQFHLMIARLSRNKYLYQAIVDVRSKLRQYSSLDAFPQDQTPAEYYRNIIAPCHDELLNAIENGDALSARAWMYTDAVRARSKYFHSYKNPYVVRRAARHTAVSRESREP